MEDGQMKEMLKKLVIQHEPRNSFKSGKISKMCSFVFSVFKLIIHTTL